jgi:O-antigen ligase
LTVKRLPVLQQISRVEENAPMGRFSLFNYIVPAAAVLLGLSWLMPLHFLPWLSWHSEILSFLAVLVMAWFGLVSLIKEKEDSSKTIYFPATALPFVALALMTGIQAATGQISFWGDVLILWFYMALCVICAILGYGARRPRKAFELKANDEVGLNSALTTLASILVLGAFISAIVAYAQIFELWQGSALINRMSFRRPGANVAQPNHLATLLLMGMVSVLYLYESGKLKALPSGLIFLVLSFALAMTESRTGVLSFLSVSGWWLIKKRQINFKASSWLIAFGGVGFLGMFWTWPSLYDFIFQNSGIETKVNTEAGTRLVVWPQLLEALSQRPWLGWGLGDVSEAHNAVAHAYEISEPFSYSHNILLDLALGVGVPIALLIALTASAWLWRHMRHANRLPIWFCLALAVPFTVHSMLEFPFAYAYFLVPVMFALGALENMAGTKPAFCISARAAVPLLFGISFVMAWSAVEYFVIEEDFRIARFEALKVGQTPSDYQRPDVVLLTQLDILLNGARIIPKPHMAAEELEIAKKAALHYPWTATQNRYALSLALNGNTEEAIRQLRVMRALHGKKKYQEIKANWDALAQDKYPQLRDLNLP